MRKTSKNFVEKAKSYLGTTGSSVFLPVYNAQSKLPVGYKVKSTDDWCATFVSTIALMCGMSDIILPECGCERMINLYKAKNQWIEDESIVPKVGYLIFYDWQDSGAGDNKGFADHVGIVEKVEGNTITVIEGNYGTNSNNQLNKVATRKINVNARYVRGYACPKYDEDVKAGERVKVLKAYGSMTNNTDKYDYHSLELYGTVLENVKGKNKRKDCINPIVIMFDDYNIRFTNEEFIQ